MLHTHSYRCCSTILWIELVTLKLGSEVDASRNCLLQPSVVSWSRVTQWPWEGRRKDKHTPSHRSYYLVVCTWKSNCSQQLVRWHTKPFGMLDTADIEGTIQNWPRLVASPLGIGWIELDDGSRVQGFRQAGKERLASLLVLWMSEVQILFQFHFWRITTDVRFESRLWKLPLSGFWPKLRVVRRAAGFLVEHPSMYKGT